MFVSLETIAQLEEAARNGCLYSLAQLEQINSESSALCQCGSSNGANGEYRIGYDCCVCGSN